MDTDSKVVKIFHYDICLIILFPILLVFSLWYVWEDKGVCLIVTGKGLGNNGFSVTGFIEFQRAVVNMYLISDQKFYVSSCYVMLDGSLLHRHPITDYSCF